MEREAYKVILMRAAAIFVLLALFMSTVFAYQLAVKVTVAGETLAVGTNVSVATGGVELYTQKTGLDGYARFTVSQGSYFLLLRRGGYPVQVAIIRVDGDTNVTRTIWQTTSYASAYGQLMGPNDFSNSSVTAYSNGLAVKKTEPNPDGFYIVSFLPEGTYNLQFSAPGYDVKTVESFLPGGDYTPVSAELQKTLPPQEPQLSLAVPQAVAQKSLISVLLSKGSLPVAGERIEVKTPSGAVAITTGADGTAALNAVDPGTYVFTYKNLVSQTIVQPSEVPKQNVSTPVSPPAKQEVPAPIPEEKPDYTALSVVVLVLLGMILVGGALFSVWYMVFGRKKSEHKGHHAHPHHGGHKTQEKQ